MTDAQQEALKRVMEFIRADQEAEARRQKEAQEQADRYCDRYKIFKPVVEWCEKHLYNADMLVTITADGETITTIFWGESMHKEPCNYEFLNDWDEGQSEIKLEGFMPIEYISLYNAENHKHLDTDCGFAINDDYGWWSAD